MKLMDINVQPVRVSERDTRGRVEEADEQDEDDDEDDENAEEENGDVEKQRLQSLVDYEAIYPRNKRVHFQQLKEQSGVEYEDMLFFDNEYGNISDVGRLGVVCAYCPQGLSEGSWIQGMEAFQDAKKKNKNKAKEETTAQSFDY
ncbi:hypothetical protein PINS_up000762 [Pythium insidiosum]|nr:hypothetical protein PINS_up000762 [Pythium insidiosum]